MPALILLAGEDNVNPNTECQEAAKKSAIPDAVKIAIYPGAQHAFDMSELPPKMNYAFGTLGYHPQANAAAWEEIDAFFSQCGERTEVVSHAYQIFFLKWKGISKRYGYWSRWVYP